MRRVLAALWSSLPADDKENAAFPSSAKAVRGRTALQRSSGPKPARRPGGYTFVEILIAGVIAALTLSVATAAIAAMVRHSKPSGGLVTVVIGNAFANNFYGVNSANIDSPVAPSYSSAALAEVMRDQLENDIASASAVFVLARNDPNTIRPMILANLDDATAKTLTTPEAFRNFIDPGQTVYGAYEGAATNLDATTIYILAPSTNANEARVRAIYEADILQTASPSGFYASVRRYEGAAYTEFYHVFYPNTAETPDTNSFRPGVVHFDRAVATNGDANLDRFRVASNRPFYFVWWPDPAARRLNLTNNRPATPASGSPRLDYFNMAGRTPLFMVVPAFPAL